MPIGTINNGEIGTSVRDKINQAISTLNESNATASSVTATGTRIARTLATRFAEIFNVKDFGALGNNAAKRSAAGYRDRRALAPSTVPAQGPRGPATGAVALSGARLHAGASAEINPRHALTPPSESPCVNGPGMTSAGGLLVRLPLAVAAKRRQVAVPS